MGNLRRCVRDPLALKPEIQYYLKAARDCTGHPERHAHKDYNAQNAFYRRRARARVTPAFSLK